VNKTARKEVMKHLEDCSLRHKQLAKTMYEGSSCLDQIILPSCVEDLASEGSTLKTFPARGGMLYREERTVRVVAGTQGDLLYLTQPKYILFNDVNDALISQANWGGNVIQVSAVTGLAEYDVWSKAPYGVANYNREVSSMLYHFSIELTSNSSAVTDRAGRLFVGCSGVGTLTGLNGTNLETLQNFRDFDLTTLDEASNCKYVHAVSGQGYTAASVPTEVFTGPEMVCVFGEGLAAGTILEFRVVIIGAYWGIDVPYQIPCYQDQPSIDCAISCLVQALPQGFSYVKREQTKISKRLRKVGGIEAARTTPFLDQVWEGAKWLWNNGGSDLARIAMQALTLI
jgi:hypothetical protein